MGNGALGALHNYTDPLDVDGVALSHLHADHCVDLTGFYVLRRYHPSGSTRRSRSGVRRDPPSGWRAPTTCRRRRG